MSWLKTVGQIALAGAKIAGFAPLVMPFIPEDRRTTVDAIVARTTDTLSSISGVIAQAEIMGQALALPGADKLKGATPAVAQLVLQSSILAGKKIADPAKFQAGCQQIAAGVADVLNSLHDAAEVTPT